MAARLPAHLEVAGLIRRTQAEGGFAAVIRKGEPVAGTILLVLTERGANARIYERMPQADGSQSWHCARRQDAAHQQEVADYLERRANQDFDLWIIELDIADAERLIDKTVD